LVLSAQLGFPSGGLQTWVYDLGRYQTAEAVRLAFLNLGLRNETAIRSRTT
jgi:hypothetical protein